MDRAGDCSKLWSTVKELLSSNAKPPANRHIFDAKKFTPHHDRSKCANNFNQQYTPHCKKNEKQKRNTLRTIKKLEIVLRMLKCNTVKEAIQDTKKRKALGPDRIAPIHSNHLGPIALKYLTDAINFSVNSAKIPKFWKRGRVIPVRKPGKPSDEHIKLRPIALFSRIAKLTEKHLLCRISTERTSAWL